PRKPGDRGGRRRPAPRESRPGRLANHLPRLSRGERLLTAPPAHPATRGCARAAGRRSLATAIGLSRVSSTQIPAETHWLAPAKLNLFLHVTGRRPDGFHDLQTLFQLIDLCDDIAIAVRDDGRIERTAGAAEVPPESDLVVRAAEALKAATGTPLCASIRVKKRIPMGGGLGGGSSDAATTLLALNHLWHTGLIPD